MTTTAKSRRLQATATTPLLWLLFVIDAGLLITSGIIHFHLWQIAYKDVPTFRYLFLIQAAGAVLAGLVLLATRRLLIVLGCLLLMLGTIIGFVVVRTTTLFGFHLTFTSGLASTVLVVEAVAIGMLAATAGLLGGRRS
jgi:hypothetical protein